MSRIEDRLTEALGHEAEALDVDALGLLAATRERLPVRRARRRTPVVLLASAAALMVVAGVGLGIDRLGGDDRVASDRSVDTAFTCPEQQAVDLSGAQDEFVPDLRDQTPAQVAEENRAPRWRFDEDGDTARLYLGNADGTLGSITTYTKRDGTWVMARSTVCGNGSPATPTSDGLRLGVRDTEPHPPQDALATGDRGLTPVLVDDRSVYDYSGLVTRHRSLYVAPCGARFCWSSGQPGSSITTQSPTGHGDARAGLRDLSDIFFLADDMVGRDQPFVFLAMPDQPGATAFEVTAGSEDYSGARLTDPSWGERAVWVALAPYDGRSVRAELRGVDGVIVGQDVEVTDD
ncbi:hypothetical protein [Nocardioides sp.]|uniref:hypothetical protein n=1 Tax=Nocardioides sp. TaxID=35761 RepID=UPI00286A46B6|nr:hypothetical protein [Nocardioides sp.]